MPDFISIGECMIELYSEQPIDVADTFIRSFAGDSLNIAVAASRMGTSVGYITRLGSDPFAAYLLKAWQDEGVDTTHVKTVDGFNAVHFVAQLPDGDREFVYYRRGSAPSTMQPSDLDPSYIAGARIMHLSGIAQAISPSARATVLRAAEIAHDAGVDVSYDPNYRHQLWSPPDARDAMREVMPYVTYFLPSCPVDTQVLFDTSDPQLAIHCAQELGVRLTAVTCGADGAVVSDGHEVFHVPAYTPDAVVDTTGAGDAFNGAFLHGLLDGLSVREAARLGSIAAGLKLRGRGALAAMPSRDEVYLVFGS